MSLVEKAVGHLEQLRKAGQEMSGDLGFPPSQANVSDANDVGSTIERAAGVLQTLPDTLVRPLPHESGVPNPIPPQSAPPEWLFTSEEVKALDTAVVPDVGVPGGTKHGAAATTHFSASGERRSQVVDIDTAHLTARGLLSPDVPESRLANELRVIKRPLVNNCRTNQAAAVDNANRIMITSAVPGEGKSFVSVNLALSIAVERDSTVLLVEADPTRPTIGSLLGVKAQRGLMDLLANPALDVSEVMYRTNIGRLSFLPVGKRQSHATELLASAAMEQLVAQLATRYSDRILIFDTPPLLAAPEPRSLARFMGQVVFVVEADQTPQSSVIEALSTIEECPVVFTVLNKSTAREEGNYYYYG